MPKNDDGGGPIIIGGRKGKTAPAPKPAKPAPKKRK